jgi:hypothetical protein
MTRRSARTEVIFVSSFALRAVRHRRVAHVGGHRRLSAADASWLSKQKKPGGVPAGADYVT